MCVCVRKRERETETEREREREIERESLKSWLSLINKRSVNVIKVLTRHHRIKENKKKKTNPQSWFPSSFNHLYKRANDFITCLQITCACLFD